MKKFSTIIITLICFFSIVNKSFAWEWYIEELLDINYWIEEYELELQNLEFIYFLDENKNIMFNEFNKINELLKKEIIKKYKNKKFNYYQTKWIIWSYKKFIYYTNRLFYYISLKEKKYNYNELDESILKTYLNVRIYYKKTESLIYRKHY